MMTQDLQTKGGNTATKKKESTIDAITHTIECNEPVHLLPLSDLHVGDAHCDYDLISSYISRIKNEEHTYTILAGDLMNSAITNSKSDAYNEALNPQEQLDRCYTIFEPIRDKILALVPGNHEERISRSVGMDTTKLLADRLGISERFRSTSALVILKVGQYKKYGSKAARKVFYSLYVNHGHGGGRRPGGKLNSLDDLSQIIDADIILQGHTHIPAVYRQAHYRISQQNCTATIHEQIMVNLPSAMMYGGYGERAGYKPGSNKYPELILCDSDYKIDVII